MDFLKSFIMMLCLTMVGGVSMAQKGAGNMEGIAQNGDYPSLQEIAGTITEIKEGPCQNTTGRSKIGIHFIVKTAANEIFNLHLGPKKSVDQYLSTTEVGDEIKASAFTTSDLSDGHFIVKEYHSNNETIVLRDESFKPVWSLSKRSGKRRRNN